MKPKESKSKNGKEGVRNLNELEILLILSGYNMRSAILLLFYILYNIRMFFS